MAALPSLKQAVDDGDEATVRAYLAKGPSLKTRNMVLFDAALHGHTGIAVMMLDAGASIHWAEPHSGMTPLMVAAQEGHPDTVTLLLKRGARVKDVSKNGSTALHYAVYRNHIEIASILCNAGANVNARDKFGHTPLHFAAQRGNCRMGAILVQHGAKMDAADKYGQTPLIVAAHKNHTDFCKGLAQSMATGTNCFPDVDPPRSCQKCGQGASSSITLKSCGKCRAVWYCSKEHQKEHWSTHKGKCDKLSAKKKKKKKKKKNQEAKA